MAGGAFDIQMNDNALWSNVLAAVWNYKLGDCHVLKKWLSYREHKILGRPLLPGRGAALHRHRAAHRRHHCAGGLSRLFHVIGRSDKSSGAARRSSASSWPGSEGSINVTES